MSGLSFRGPALFGCVAMLALVLGVGLWAFTVQLSGAILTQGRVVASGHNVPLQHPDGGLVAAVLVQEGDRVTIGQVLLRLDGAALHSDLAILRARLGEVSARIARAEAERDGSRHLSFPADMLALARIDPAVAAQLAGQGELLTARLAAEAKVIAQIEQRKAQTRARLVGLAAQQAAIDELSQLLHEELALTEPLVAAGLAPLARLRDLQREAARLAGQLGELAAATAAAQDQIAELDLQLASLAAGRREEATRELRELWSLRLELEERARELEGRIARLDLRAPVDGVVLGLQVTVPGTVLQSGAPALHLVPTADLQISARLAPRHIASIAAGQTADLVFPTSDHGQVPRLQGKVMQVSADILNDPQSGLAAYEVKITLPSEMPRAAGIPELRPGMPVEVYLQTGSRPAIAYLLDPFTRYFARALREG